MSHVQVKTALVPDSSLWKPVFYASHKESIGKVAYHQEVSLRPSSLSTLDACTEHDNRCMITDDHQ